MEDPAFVAVERYWKAEDTRRNAASRVDDAWRSETQSARNAFLRHGKIKTTDELDAAPGSVRDRAARDYCVALRAETVALDTVAAIEPATMRGAIEMLSAAMAQFRDVKFPPPQDRDLLADRVAVQIIQRVQDAMERWARPSTQS